MKLNILEKRNTIIKKTKEYVYTPSLVRKRYVNIITKSENEFLNLQ